MTPNKDNIRLWVAALRSGRFRQGQGALASSRRTFPSESFGPLEHCCLGVACEVAIESGVNVDRHTQKPNGLREAVYFDHEPDFLPARVREWLGIGSKNPELRVLTPRYDVVTKMWLSDQMEEVHVPAAALNDGDDGRVHGCRSFEDIADAIERTYLVDADEEDH